MLKANADTAKATRGNGTVVDVEEQANRAGVQTRSMVLTENKRNSLADVADDDDSGKENGGGRGGPRTAETQLSFEGPSFEGVIEALDISSTRIAETRLWTKGLSFVEAMEKLNLGGPRTAETQLRFKGLSFLEAMEELNENHNEHNADMARRRENQAAVDVELANRLNGQGARQDRKHNAEIARRQEKLSMEEVEVKPTALPLPTFQLHPCGCQIQEHEMYCKILKMGVPPESVRHKVLTEGVDDKTSRAVLDRPSEGDAGKAADKKASNNSSAKSALSEDEENIASKFRTMLKMGVPPDAVRHKMSAEDVDAKIVAAVLDKGQTPQEEEKAGSATQLSEDEEQIADKYRRMLKMGVPLDGVQHKMKTEGIDIKIILALSSQPLPSNDSSAENKAAAKKKNAAAGPELTEEEEAIASTYRTMLKVCVPKDSVRHKMKQEGVSAKIIESVVGSEGDGSKMGAAPKAANNRKTVALHWTTSNLAPEQLGQSIFGRRGEKINPEEADIKKLKELFQKKTAKSKMSTGSAGQGSGPGGDGVSSGMAKVLDLTRANNIAISLKAFNDDFTFRSLAETINDVDPESKIVGERVQFIPNLLPTPKEIAAIKKYNGDNDKLITAELFFRQLVSIRRIRDKVSVMQTMVTFNESISEAQASFRSLQSVCTRVINSEKLFQVLCMVLNVGNLMNAGSVNGGVEAFKFESLSRLSQTKSANGKTTLLDFIAETFIEKGERQALLLMSEFPDIKESSRLLIGDLVGNMNTLQKNYKLCKTELTSMKRDQSSKREEEEPPKPADTRQAMFAAIKNQKKGVSVSFDKDSNSSAVKYTPGVHRLQKFLGQSKTTLSLAERDQDAAISACKELAVYCGEQGERAAAPLLQVLYEFALSLENAVKKYDKRSPQTSARFLSQNTGSPALSGEGKGPPKATPRYPDDEASRSTTYSDERSETSSQNRTPFQQMPRQQPVQSLANNGVAEAQAKAKEVATEKAEEQERKNSKEDTKVKKVGFFNFIWG